MPAFISHYLYGVDLYKSINSKILKKCLKEHSGAFCLGLQGPDIFFYLPQSMLGPKSRNIGSLMHEKKVSAFFYAYVEHMSSLDLVDRATAIAYLSGLIAHNTLDASVHPYIYFRVNFDAFAGIPGKYYFGMHGELESAIDMILLKRHKKMTPSKFHPHKVILPTPEELNVLAPLISTCINETYFSTIRHSVHPFHIRESIHCMKLSSILLHSRSGKRKHLISGIEKLLVHRNIIATTILYDNMPDRHDAMNLKHMTWHNPWEPSRVSNKDYDALYQDAKDQYMMIASLLSDCLKSTQVTDHQKILLIDAIGNKSYHSGLDSLD